MREYLSLLGQGYNHLAPNVIEKIDDRIRELVENDFEKLNAWEVVLYQRGEEPIETVYKVAEQEACEQILEDLGYGQLIY